MSLVEQILAQAQAEGKLGKKGEHERQAIPANLPEPLRIILELAEAERDNRNLGDQEPSLLGLEKVFDDIIKSKKRRNRKVEDKPKPAPLTPGQQVTYNCLLPLEGEPPPVDDEDEEDDRPSSVFLGGGEDPLGLPVEEEGIPEEVAEEVLSMPDAPQEIEAQKAQGYEEIVPAPVEDGHLRPVGGLLEEEIEMLELPILQKIQQLQRVADRSETPLEIRIFLLLFLNPSGLRGGEIASLTGYSEKNIHRPLGRLIESGAIQKNGKRFIFKNEGEE